MSKKIFKSIVIIIAILICYTAFIMYCKSRKYIDFIYVTESDYTNLDYFESYNFPDNCEFTWWWHFPSQDVDSIAFIDETFGTKFKETLDYTIDKSKVDIIISFGRKLKTIYYDPELFPPRWMVNNGMVRVTPVFEKEYNHKIYLYVTDKKYNIYPAEFWGDDIIQFNRYGNVCFEEE